MNSNSRRQENEQDEADAVDDSGEDDEEEESEEDDGDTEPETLKDRLARKSPRVHGLVALAFGAFFLLVNFALMVVNVYQPFTLAIGSGLLALGVWTIGTNHSHLQSPESVPSWWKVGAVIVVLFGMVTCYIVTH